MSHSFADLVLSLFLDEEGRKALARRSQTSQLKNELNIERAKTNALVAAINLQGKQNLGISDKRRARIAAAFKSQIRVQDTE